jgi:hypothetical protein
MENNMLKCLSRHKTRCPSTHMVSCAKQDVVEKLDSFSLLLPCKLKKQFNGV